MNYCWLVSNCSSLFYFFFRFSLLSALIFIFVFFCIFPFVFVSLLLCFLLYALNSSHNIYPYLCRVLFFSRIFSLLLS